MGRKRKGFITKVQEKQLQKMAKDMLKIAADLTEEYSDLNLPELSKLSGSLTQIHEDSPFLDEIFKGDSWKKVIKNIPPLPKANKDDTEDDSK